MPDKPADSQVDVAKFRQTLLEERRRLQGVLRQTGIPEDRLGGDQADLMGELSDYPDHPADQATETFEREIDMTVRKNARDLLEQVEDALRKIENGTYGICASCGKPIPEGRLVALPSAVYCVPCQSALEGL